MTLPPRGLLGLILLALALAACNGGAAGVPNVGANSPAAERMEAAAKAAQVPFPAATDSDPFYAQPSPFPKAAPGTILASRSVTYAPVGGAPMANPAWQIKFVSRDANMQPIAAVATVVKPLTPASPEPLLGVLYAEDSLGAQCAPSHAVTGSVINTTTDAEAPLSLQGLTRGWAVVYPDTEGPLSEYAPGRLEGHITLDALRAAIKFAPLGMNADTKLGLTGYSGGAIAAAWAASLQRSYAPNLNIVAIASGGTPADIKQILENVDTDPAANAAAFSLVFSAVIGINRAYPDFFTPILNASGVAAATSLENGCDGRTSSNTSGPSGTFPEYTTTSNPFDAPNVEKTFPLISLPLSGHSPMANTFVYHSELDELIPIAGVETMVSAWCAAGSHVAFYRGLSGDHIAFEPTTSPLVYAYLASRFKDASTALPPGTTTCNE